MHEHERALMRRLASRFHPQIVVPDQVAEAAFYALALAWELPKSDIDAVFAEAGWDQDQVAAYYGVKS